MSERKPLAVIVDWFGPYSSQQEAAKCHIYNKKVP